jgi:energy-coupling factor transporter ATP-binding protein EcfA2
MPCEISLKLSGKVEVRLKVMGLSKYKLDLFVDETSIRDSISEPQYQKIIEDIFALRATYTPPVAGLSPVEDKLNHPQLMQKLDRGLISECWRSYLWWLWNDGSKEGFDQVIEVVERYLPNTVVREPKLTHDSPERVLIEFEQDGLTFDMSTSGGGFRTVLGLAVILCFSRSKCLLLDEPDAHLHSSLQRQVARMLLDHTLENQVQVFVASHAPDFIAEVPVEYLSWIDRTKNEAGVCNSVGSFLVDLGAMTKADAVRASGADKILFVEAGLDQKVINQFVDKYYKESPERRNLFDDSTVIVAKLPSGKGDREHLQAFQRLIREVFDLDVKIACIVDNDYDFPENSLEEHSGGSAPLLLALKRKEIENYLLDPDVISRAAKDVAKNRELRTQRTVDYPTLQEIQGRISQLLNSPEIHDIVYDRIVPKYRATLNSELDDVTKEERGRQWFADNWSDLDWQIRHCPGKMVLAQMRKWCQEQYSLTLTSQKLISALQQYPEDVLDIMEKLQEYFYDSA